MKQNIKSSLAIEKSSTISKALILIYGVVSYLIFFVVILYMIAFTGNLLVPKGVDSGTVISPTFAIIINISLILILGIQHSVMARPNFKAWITRYIPQSMERSTFVLVSSLVMILLLWQWQPMPKVLWLTENPIGEGIIYALGWGLLFLATFLIDHFELFGLKQVFQQLKTYQPVYPTFKTPMLYKIVRHPMMVGIIIGLWATPLMTIGHALFAFCMTIYILIGIHYEGKDLMKTFGKQYEKYKQNVPKIIPGF